MKLRISLDRGGKIYLQKTKTWRKESAKADRLVIDIGPAALFFWGLFVLLVSEAWVDFFCTPPFNFCRRHLPLLRDAAYQIFELGRYGCVGCLQFSLQFLLYILL